jgi:hypothetical protein
MLICQCVDVQEIKVCVGHRDMISQGPPRNVKGDQVVHHAEGLSYTKFVGEATQLQPTAATNAAVKVYRSSKVGKAKCYHVSSCFQDSIYIYTYIYIVCKVYFIQVTCRETFLLAKALVKASQKFTFGVTNGLWIFRINRTIGMEVMNFSPKAKLLNLFEAEPKPICVPPLLKVSKKTLPRGTDGARYLLSPTIGSGCF